jgi:phage gp36-like protein
VLTLEVTSGGGGSLTVTLETAPTSSGPWRVQGAFATLAAPGRAELAFAPVSRYVRAAWALTGGTFTFDLRGLGHTAYATPADLVSGALTAAALANVSQDVQARACIAASDEADGYLSRSKTLPLLQWPTELSRKVARVAGFETLSSRGFQPQGPSELILLERDRAITWLGKVGSGAVNPPGLVDSTPQKRAAAPRIASYPSRGWEVPGSDE